MQLSFTIFCILFLVLFFFQRFSPNKSAQFPSSTQLLFIIHFFLFFSFVSAIYFVIYFIPIWLVVINLRGGNQMSAVLNNDVRPLDPWLPLVDSVDQLIIDMWITGKRRHVWVVQLRSSSLGFFSLVTCNICSHTPCYMTQTCRLYPHCHYQIRSLSFALMTIPGYLSILPSPSYSKLYSCSSVPSIHTPTPFLSSLCFSPKPTHQSFYCAFQNGAVSTLAAVGEDLPLDYGEWFPKPDPSERRRAGVLLHPTSFRGPHGIGDLGDEAFRFIDWLHNAGCSVWQVRLWTLWFGCRERKDF